jgi:ribosome-binding protein aMBF1 (putative translation factor)
MYQDGNMSAADIADEIGMSRGMCSAMLGGKTWKHLPYPQIVDKARGQVRGVKVALAKLDDDKVRVIRSELARGISRLELARRYGVNKSTIRNIDDGVTWRHVK